jgi:hypothetical protein
MKPLLGTCGQFFHMHAYPFIYRRNGLSARFDYIESIVHAFSLKSRCTTHTSIHLRSAPWLGCRAVPFSMLHCPAPAYLPYMLGCQRSLRCLPTQPCSGTHFAGLLCSCVGSHPTVVSDFRGRVRYRSLNCCQTTIGVDCIQR